MKTIPLVFDEVKLAVYGNEMPNGFLQANNVSKKIQVKCRTHIEKSRKRTELPQINNILIR